MKNSLIFLIISISIFSCASAKKNFFPSATNLPPHTGEVKILDKLPENYIDIGWINIEDNTTWIELYKAAKDKARSHGANAIVYSPENCKQKWGGTRSIICRAIYIGNDKNTPLESDLHTGG